jgi:oxygen-independent coproporphyrinogen III oxidase
MDHFSLATDTLFKAAENGKLHRNFMGYTHTYTQLMIGLGVSSISDTWYAYGQNVKKVEEYYECLAQNTFPIFKGHFLSEEDLTIRRHILSIMCKFETSWEHTQEQCDAVYTALEKLVEMEKDKLVEIQPYHLKVKPAARPFIRNICMCFDARLWRNLPQAQIFSSIV